MVSGGQEDWKMPHPVVFPPRALNILRLAVKAISQHEQELGAVPTKLLNAQVSMDAFHALRYSLFLPNTRENELQGNAVISLTFCGVCPKSAL